MTMPYHPGAEKCEYDQFRLWVTPFRVNDLYSTLLSEVRSILIMTWFQAFAIGLQGMLVLIHLPFAGSQTSHISPLVTSHWVPYMKPMLLKNWATSNSMFSELYRS